MNYGTRSQEDLLLYSGFCLNSIGKDDVCRMHVYSSYPPGVDGKKAPFRDMVWKACSSQESEEVRQTFFTPNLMGHTGSTFIVLKMTASDVTEFSANPLSCIPYAGVVVCVCGCVEDKAELLALMRNKPTDTTQLLSVLSPGTLVKVRTSLQEQVVSAINTLQAQPAFATTTGSAVGSTSTDTSVLQLFDNLRQVDIQ